MFLISVWFYSKEFRSKPFEITRYFRFECFFRKTTQQIKKIADNINRRTKGTEQFGVKIHGRIPFAFKMYDKDGKVVRVISSPLGDEMDNRMGAEDRLRKHLRGR